MQPRRTGGEGHNHRPETEHVHLTARCRPQTHEEEKLNFQCFTAWVQLGTWSDRRLALDYGRECLGSQVSLSHFDMFMSRVPGQCFPFPYFFFFMETPCLGLGVSIPRPHQSLLEEWDRYDPQMALNPKVANMMHLGHTGHPDKLVYRHDHCDNRSSHRRRSEVVGGRVELPRVLSPRR